MNILDIDLDFFLNHIIHNKTGSKRASSKIYMPWSDTQVRSFFENELNISTKIPGAVVVNHQAVFYRWRELIQQKRLTPPFHVVHVDAHADLGCGMPSWVYLHDDFIKQPVEARTKPKRGNNFMNFGNYLAFAIGNRWVSSIDFVAPSFWRNDIHPFLVPAGITPALDTIVPLEIKEIPLGAYKANKDNFDFFKIAISCGEPTVNLNIKNHTKIGKQYKRTKWDFIFLSKSPAYTPATSDALIPVIKEYISPI